MAMIMSGLMVTMPLSVTTAVTAGAEDAVTEETVTEPVGGVYDGITWSFDGETLVFEGTGSSKVEDYNTAPWAVYKKQVKKIVLKKGIISIRGEGSYPELTEVVVEEGVQRIEWAFCGCQRLSKVNLPDSLTAISQGAFSSCSSLENIDIPASVKDVDIWAFKGTPWLEKQENPVIINDILIDGRKCSGDVIIPDTVKKIANDAFCECETITSLTIPDSVEEIGIWTFECCTGLTKVNIPNSLKIIDAVTFAGCSGLTEIVIPDSVEEIREVAFCECSSLEKVTIPSSVKYFGWRAFSGTPWLKAKQEENPLVIINDILINGQKCTGDVVIPDGVKSIAPGAFQEI